MTWLGNPRTERGATPPVTPQGCDHHINASPYKELRNGPLEPVPLRERPLPWPIRWDELRADFISWSERVARHSEEHRASMIRYLDRHLSGREIRTIEDLRLILAECERGRGHLQRGLRNLFKFLEWSGWPEEALEPLRRIVKIDRTKVDNEVPDEGEVLGSLKAIHSYVAGKHGGRHTKAELAYWALYNVLLDSGAKLRHAIEVFNGWDEMAHTRRQGHITAP